MLGGALGLSLALPPHSRLSMGGAPRNLQPYLKMVPLLLSLASRLLLSSLKILPSAKAGLNCLPSQRTFLLTPYPSGTSWIPFQLITRTAVSVTLVTLETCLGVHTCMCFGSQNNFGRRFRGGGISPGVLEDVQEFFSQRLKKDRVSPGTCAVGCGWRTELHGL